MTAPTPALDDPGTVVRLAGRALELYARAVAESPLTRLARPRPVRRQGFEFPLCVERVVREAQDIVGITFADPSGGPLHAWSPGAHLDLILPSGRVRQYSLCGDPRDRSRYRIAVRRLADGDGGSREVHALRRGDRLSARGPRNAFRLVAAPAYLFVAAGIGITPILPMVHRAARSGVPWRLVYLGRSRATLPFLGELLSLPGGAVDLHTDDADGFADLAALLAGPPHGADVYVCGPPALMDTARQLLRVADATTPVFSERFSAPPVIGGAPFVVDLARSGVSVEVGAGETTLAAIRRALPGVVYSCRQGFCRSCKCRVLDGTVDHRDTTLLESERADHMLICVSRAAGARLTLDL